MFRYTLKLYPADTTLQSFDLTELFERLAASDLHRPVIDGYVKRWGDLLRRADAL